MKVGDVFSYKDDSFFAMGIVIKIEGREIWFLNLNTNGFFTKHDNGLCYFVKDSLIGMNSEILCSIEQPFDKS